MTGRWNTIACRPRPFVAPRHEMAPDVGVSSPWHRRIKTLFPAPFDPRMTVRGPLTISADTPSMMIRPLMAKKT